MSINHFSSDLPETVWWSQPQYHHHHHHNMETPTKSGSGTTTASTTFWGNSPLHHHHHRAAAAAASSGGLSSFNFDLNNEDEEETVERRDQEIPKEAMFEKALTPSDVGKLNRLVIPKQHAEKYFPLNAAGGNETGPEKGLLLSFEDELGKPWRFRYSYWNSSQSYVLTKGWSRFVKEKKLDAGDIVVFERHRLEGDRMLIGWRRRTSAVPTAHHDSGVGGQSAAAVGGGGGGWTRVYFNTSGHNNPYPDQQAHNHHHHPRHGSGFPYQSDHYLHAGVGVVGGGVLQQKPTGGGANSKRLRLFGVNMECHQDSPEEVVDSDHSHHHRLSTTPPEGSSTSSSHGQPEGYYPPFQYYSPKAYFNHQSHLNINFTRDAKETR